MPVGAEAHRVLPPKCAAIAQELLWTDGARSFCRRGEVDQVVVPSSSTGLVDLNCDGPLDRPFVGGQLISDPLLRKAYGPRVVSSTLAVAWVAAGRRAAYVSDGEFRNNVHFSAGIAICRAAGCVISDLDGNPLHTGHGLLISADQDTHDHLLEIVEPHLRAVRTGTLMDE